MTVLEPDTKSTDADDDLVHTCCCLDDHKMLCGLVNDGDIPWVDKPTSCIVCRELMETDFCPNGFICPDPLEIDA